VIIIQRLLDVNKLLILLLTTSKSILTAYDWGIYQKIAKKKAQAIVGLFVVLKNSLIMTASLLKDWQSLNTVLSFAAKDA
jgi:hypothetical protein